MIDFNKLIDKHLRRESRPKTVGRYYPSEIAGCMRNLWYTYKNPKETPAERIRLFEAGNILHNFVVEVLKSEKNPEVQLLWSEHPFKMDIEDFTVSGRVDDLILLMVSGKTVLVEVKSAKSIEYLETPQPHHVMQLQLYMHSTGVHNGILLYIERNSLDSKVFTVPFNQRLAAQALERFKQLHRFLKENRVPEPEARLAENRPKMGWRCGFCDYRVECYQDTPKGQASGDGNG